jgi:hypothetical protein
MQERVQASEPQLQQLIHHAPLNLDVVLSIFVEAVQLK